MGYPVWVGYESNVVIGEEYSCFVYTQRHRNYVPKQHTVMFSVRSQCLVPMLLNSGCYVNVDMEQTRSSAVLLFHNAVALLSKVSTAKREHTHTQSLKDVR
jgi:hypothetical protein